ncbi:hypothetical protein L198_06235 [Cryptococcus wingfieldii CBS 7118]|uniref:Sugar phosphate transporter domain-containing protein n=1 Tax=Cryptococcus wingfieldii CBS 7118 TaxID=1295528 RepID=A0A1E3INN6_9TREE|nr:hypothetical protein L198_06235 [Cryptococcus wingfieldii CBS 7118]ODN90217.1 hypothetical protein L198_06235 [Cryptococcus wingfieldii CBS 7118]
MSTASDAPLERSSSSTSLSGMGIHFPPSSPSPLPPSLSPFPRPGESKGGYGEGMQRSLSDDGSGKRWKGAVPDASGGGAASSGTAMAHSYSNAASLPPFAAPVPVHTQSSLHPTYTPTRPRTISPRPPSSPSGQHPQAQESSQQGFASSTAYGAMQSEAARGRVISPQKDPGAPSPLDPSSSSSSALAYASANGYDASNPYSSPSSTPLRSHHNGGSSKDGYQSLFPLTGEESHLGSSPTVHQEKVKFTDSTTFWLGLYFLFNLGLTLYNKALLMSFRFPYTLTGLHALSGSAGCYIALERGAFVPARLTQRENLILAAFSVLYTVNIAISNVSLQLVSIPFHQVVRASTPLFTIFISLIFLRTRFSLIKLVSLLPVVAGVGFATYGDYSFTAWGLILTLLGTFLAALKTVVTNLIQTGSGGRLKLHPLDLLMRMSPLAFIQCVLYAWHNGELEHVRAYGATQMTRTKAVALLVNGVIACGLNIVSFTANKKAGALTMTVSANCKQVLTIALAVVLFGYTITPTNSIGILLTLVGGGWYGWVEFQEKKKKTKVSERS